MVNSGALDWISFNVEKISGGTKRKTCSNFQFGKSVVKLFNQAVVLDNIILRFLERRRSTHCLFLLRNQSWPGNTVVWNTWMNWQCLPTFAVNVLSEYLVYLMYPIFIVFISMFLSKPLRLHLLFHWVNHTLFAFLLFDNEV